jgi:predicted metalloprotease
LKLLKRVPVGLTVPALVAACLLSACTAATTHKAQPSASVLAPDANIPVVDDGHTEFDRIVKNAIDDVQTFWQRNYPTISGGKPYSELMGKSYSVDGANITPEVKKNACLQQDPTGVVDNAFYCRADDSVVYDRNPKHLVPLLGQKYGALMVAAVIAHEWGHVVQQRLGIFDRSPEPPTLITESQADCAAGAFIRTVQDQQALHFRLTQPELDQTLLGYLQVRDPPPLSSAQISHGNGFDRLSAIADGIAGGAGLCFSAGYFDRRFTERPFTTEADYLNHGNLPYQQMIRPGPVSEGGSGLQPDLNRFWKQAAAAINKPWKDVSAAQAPHPPCRPGSPTEFGYCPTDNRVYFSDPFAREAYFSLPDHIIDKATGNVTLIDNAPADYALGTLFVYGWGLAGRHQLFTGPLDDRDSVIAASCYAGAYSAEINTAHPPGDFALSPPDMDEATAAILKLVPFEKTYGAHGTTGLQRTQSFTKGYFGGLSAC